MCGWFTEDSITSNSAIHQPSLLVQCGNHWLSFIPVTLNVLKVAIIISDPPPSPSPPQPQSVPPWFKGICEFVIHVEWLILGLAPLYVWPADVVFNSQSYLLPHLSLCCCCAHYSSHVNVVAVREPLVWRMKRACLRCRQSRQRRAKGSSEKKKDDKCKRRHLLAFLLCINHLQS